MRTTQSYYPLTLQVLEQIIAEEKFLTLPGIGPMTCPTQAYSPNCWIRNAKVT